MSDNIKLVIEIPKKEYEAFKELIAINIGGRCSGKGIIQTCLNAVKNGTPLDSVKAEIVALPKTYPFINHIDTYVKEDDMLRILDNIGKAESKDPNDITHMFDGVTEIPKDSFKGWFSDSAPLKDCKNTAESYGEICVKCNKCGRFDKHIGKAESEE